jgi:hypothetical protein
MAVMVDVVVKLVENIWGFINLIIEIFSIFEFRIC